MQVDLGFPYPHTPRVTRLNFAFGTTSILHLGSVVQLWHHESNTSKWQLFRMTLIGFKNRARN